MNKFKLFIFLLITSFALSNHHVFAQEKNEKLVKKCQKMYPNAKAVILNTEVVYEFKFSKKRNLPYIIENRKETYLALQARQRLHRFSFYDEHSKIKQAKRVGDNNAMTLNSKVVCGNYNADGIFYSDAQICQYPFVFEEKGDMQSLMLRKVYNDPRYFTSVFFNDMFPVISQKITFVVPQWMNVKLKTFNFKDFGIEQKKTAKENGNTEYTFSMQQLAAMEDYEDVLGKTHTYPHVLVLSKGFTYKGVKTPLLGSVNDLYKWYHQVATQVENKAEVLKPLVTKLTEGKTTKEEKVKAIFYWVQDNIRYIAFEDGIAAFKPENAQKVYRKKYGDCKGMANLMKIMLKVAGFDARLTWIGTKHIAYDYSLPSIAVANHMICTLLLNNQKYYLDATEKYVPFGKYAERIQGRPVLIEDGEKYLLEKIPIAPKEQNEVSYSQKFVIEGESLRGTGKQKYQGEQKKQLLYYLNHTAKKNTKELVQLLVDQDSKNCFVDKLKFSDPSQREGAFVVDYQMKLDNMVAKFDNEMYVDLDFYKHFKGLKIEKERLSSLNFEEKVLRKVKVELQLPEGYTIKHLPANLSKTHPAFTFNIDFKTEGNKLIYTKELSAKDGIIKKADFAAWNLAIDALKKTYNDQIILIKAKK